MRQQTTTAGIATTATTDIAGSSIVSQETAEALG